MTLSHIPTTEVEIRLVCDWAKSRMVVKSGTRAETFKLETQKQFLLEQFRAASPRIFRQLAERDPTLRGISTTNNKMTILQRNIAYSIWLSEQKDFEEGDKADNAELQLIRSRPPRFMSNNRSRVESTESETSTVFDPSKWVCNPRSDQWFWATLRETNVRFLVVKKPHECSDCLQG